MAYQKPEYCPERDPLVLAGSLTCGECQGRAYPVDADWITDRLILVAYGPVQGEPDCSSHHGGRLVLVDLDAEDHTIPQPQPRACRGTVRTGSRKGQPCTHPAAAGSAYCHWHDPDRQAVR